VLRPVPGDGPNLTYLPKNIVAGLNDGGLFSPPGETYDYLEWIARLTLHIPEQGAQLVHYYGRYTKCAVLAEYRITAYDGKIVRFAYKDYAQGGAT